MNCLPVIEMEMRSAARRRWTFGLRLLFAMAGAAVCLFVMATPSISFAAQGQRMLAILGYLNLAFGLFAGGFLTADCVSSEKREGTIGLLFLTPLTGMDIVLGKMACHATQLVYGVCAVFPVFFFPLLMGGVTGAEIVRIVLALGLSLLLSASIGMFLSVLGTESRRTILNTFSSIVAIAAAPMVYLVVRQMFLPTRIPGLGLPQFSPVFAVMSGFDSSYRLTMSRGPELYWGSLAALAAMSLILIVSSGFLLGRVFQKTGDGAMARQTFRERGFHTKVIEGNPYEWKLSRNAGEARSLGGLIHGLVPLFIAMLAISLATRRHKEAFLTALFTALAIHWIAKLRLAVEATRHIQDDRQSGALELLLATPLPVNSIIQGHHDVLKAVSRKPMAVLMALNLAMLLCVSLFSRTLGMSSGDNKIFSIQFLGGMAVVAADFAAIRWLALIRGLTAASHTKAAMNTFALKMGPPWIGLGATFIWATNTRGRIDTIAAAFIAWFVFCLLYDWLIIRHCRKKLETDLRHLASEGR